MGSRAYPQTGFPVGKVTALENIGDRFGVVADLIAELNLSESGGSHDQTG